MNDRRPTLDLLPALDALLAELNVSRAAKRMGITQPAMSNVLRRLRDELGDPILVRTAKGMVPTDRARRLVSPVRKLLADANEVFADEPTFEPSTSSRRFELGARDIGQAIFLPPLLAAVEKEAPAIVLSTRDSTADDAMLLESGELDLVLGAGLPRAGGFRAQPLFRESYVCLLRRDHPLAALSRLTAAQLATLQRVAIRGLRPAEEASRRALGERAASPPTIVTSVLVGVLVVARTDRCMIIGGHIARALAPKLGLVAVALPHAVGTIEIAQYWHERRQLDPGHAWLRGLVKRVASGLDLGR